MNRSSRIQLAPLTALLFVAGCGYNTIQTLDERVNQAQGQIQTQLQRRSDLIPNLVETVKGYASHERDTLEAVVVARSGAVTATGVTDRAEAENLLTQALGRLFALAESYPQLKANQNYAALQRELATTEDKVAYARQFYNSAVQTLSDTIHSVPSNFVAGPAGVRAPDYFTTAEDERGPVQVRF
jgi:LemA protein